ncbi:ferric-chelate reductase 1-like isoform X1 [Sycon ciliatum]|uniref:ferric-chelate reductase 1-like isoform X1 n=2 Tax=Sycon ciliatum TaxID=27933 RepID=UPI0031F6E7E7
MGVDFRRGIIKMKLSMQLFLGSTAMLCCLVSSAVAYSSGNVASACSGPTPSFANHGSNSTMPAGIVLEFNNSQATYVNGETYGVTLSWGQMPFKGFLCQMHDEQERSIASVNVAEADISQVLTCGGVPNTGISHRNSNDKTSLTFTWTPSATTPDRVHAHCAVVASKMHWFHIESSDIVRAGSTPAPTGGPAVSTQPTNALQIDLSSCGKTKGCRRTPEGCTSASDCNYIFTSRVINGSIVEIELSAKAGGYVAVGFSKDTKMGDDDVFACQHDAVGRVYAKNLFNSGYANLFNAALNEGLKNEEATLVDGVISCRFHRTINGSGSQDFDLSQAYTLFFTSHPSGTAASNAGLATQHAVLPTLSQQPISASSLENIGSKTASIGLIIGHGGVMIYAWVALSGIGMFNARFMRCAAGGGGAWFKVHWITMLISVLCSLSGAIVIGVHAGTWKPSAHSAVGLTVLVLTGLQLIGAALRPPPDGEKRAMFTMFHRGNAVLVQFLAWTALFLGIDEATRFAAFNSSAAYGVLGAGVGCMILFWGYMEFRKKSQGDMSAKDETMTAMENSMMKKLSVAFSILAYGFTAGSGSLLYSAKAHGQ